MLNLHYFYDMFQDMKYIARAIERQIQKAATEFPVIVITGPRQTGKTTLLKHCFPDHHFITLDDPMQRDAAQNDPALFLDSIERPCVIDEIQYVPGLLPYIKMEVDSHRDSKGRFLLTGSQIFPLTQGLSESLAGRAAIFELLGFAQNEFPLDETELTKAVYKRIFSGSFPDPLVHGVDRNIFYGSYIQTYLERDLRQVLNVSDLSSFRNFLRLLAARTGNLLNISEIGKETGVSDTTIRRWLSILETSRIVFLLRPFHKNITKRIVKRPKLYFTDTGLAAYLLLYPNADLLLTGPSSGALFENYVVMEYIKQLSNSHTLCSPWFFRDAKGTEVDLILDFGLKKEAIEIKKAKTLKKDHYASIGHVSKLMEGQVKGTLISLYEKKLAINNTVTCVPVRELDITIFVS